jgi:hypothetical protein
MGGVSAKNVAEERRTLRPRLLLRQDGGVLHEWLKQFMEKRTQMLGY